MTPTRVRLLVALFVLGGAVGWAVFQVVNVMVDRLLPVPWTAAAALWLLAVAVLAWGLLARPRLRHRPGARPFPPLLAARTAALAMATSRTGAVVAGFYSGVLVGLTSFLAVPSAVTRAWTAGLAVLGGIAAAAAGLWLERLCRLPEDGAGAGSDDAEPDEVDLR